MTLYILASTAGAKERRSPREIWLAASRALDLTNHSLIGSTKMHSQVTMKPAKKKSSYVPGTIGDEYPRGKDGSAVSSDK